MSQRIRELLDGKTTRYTFPFFWLRGEDEATLRRYMRAIHGAGCRAVCLESRPHPDFCGPRWWHDLDILLEEAKALDMKLWILDDSHFPTGFCNGALRPAMENGDYALLRQSVTYRVLAECRRGKTLRLRYEDVREPGDAHPTRADEYFMKPFPRFGDERLLDVVAVRLDTQGGGCLSLYDGAEGDIQWTARYGRWRVYGVYLTRNRGPHRDYMNMLSLPSCRTLIDAVYEPHWQRYHDEFGKTILGFFSDEPELGNGHIYQTDKRLFEVEDLPWSDELQSALRDAWGEGWQTRLPLLWDREADPDAAAQVRFQYMDAVTRLVRRDFSEQIGNWCRAHGVRYIGHLIEDHDQHTRCGSSLGHYFRGLAGQDMAGIDDIGGQVLPQGEDLDIRTKWQDHRDGTFYHFALGRLAASAAAIEPGKRGEAMCEIFGNYGWSEGVSLEKYLADHFMVRGVNHFVPHAFSAAPFPDRDCPPHFYAHGNNPQYRHFGALIRYMERVCHLISGGTAEARVGILYHAEADWTGGKSQTCGTVGRALAQRQIDYHFIPADVFEEREKYAARVDAQERCLRVNGQRYDAFIVPESTYISACAADALEEMDRAGIPVFFINAAPKGVCTPRDRVTLAAWLNGVGRVATLARAAEECARLGLAQVECVPAWNTLRCLRYAGEDYILYYVVNEAAVSYTGRLDFHRTPRVTKAVYRYDAWQNRCLSVKMEENHLLSATLEPRKGYLYIFDLSGKIPAVFREKAGTYEKPLTDWTRSVCRAIDYPAFAQGKPVRVPDAYELEDADFGGFLRYEASLRCDSAPADPLYLAIDGDQEGLEVFVNDVSAGIQIVPTYRFEIGRLLRPGVNRVRVEQATTLERAIPRVDTVSRTPVRPGNHLGIDHPIRLIGSEEDIMNILPMVFS